MRIDGERAPEAARLPAAQDLERVAYRLHAFAGSARCSASRWSARKANRSSTSSNTSAG